jgi:hypothetical protein
MKGRVRGLRLRAQVAKYAHPDRVCAVQVPAGHAVMFNNCSGPPGAFTRPQWFTR